MQTHYKTFTSLEEIKTELIKLGYEKVIIKKDMRYWRKKNRKNYKTLWGYKFKGGLADIVVNSDEIINFNLNLYI